MVTLSGRLCTDCDGLLTMTSGSTVIGAVFLTCPEGHRTLITWPPDHPDQVTVHTPEYLRRAATGLRHLLAGLPRKRGGT